MFLRKTISSISARSSAPLLAGLAVGPIVLALLVPGLVGAREPAASSATAAAPMSPVSVAAAISPRMPGRALRECAVRGVEVRSAECGMRSGDKIVPSLTPHAALRTPHSKRSARRSAGRLVYQFVAGERRSYRIDYSNASATDFRKVLQNPNSSAQSAAAAGLVSAYRTRVQGDFVVTVLERQGDGALLACHLRRPVVTLEVNGQPSAGEAQQVQTDLGRDFFVHVNSRGQVLSVRFDPGVGSLSQSFARTLLAETQVVLPEPGAARSARWASQEADPNGQYVARYEAEPASGKESPQHAPPAVRTLRKIKARYLPVRQQPGARAIEVPMLIQPRGTLVARFDAAKGQLVSLDGDGSQIMTVQGKQVAYSKTTVRLHELGDAKLGRAELAALRGARSAQSRLAAAVSLSPKASRDESEAVLQRNELGSATVESLLADLARGERSGMSDGEQTALYLKFKALVYLRPEACAQLSRILTCAAPRSMTMAMLTGALGTVGHAQAQAALSQVIQARSQDGPALTALIPALASADSPSPTAEGTLRMLAKRSRDGAVVSSARLALGTMARQLATTSAQRAAGLVDWLIGELRASRSKVDRHQLLLALGNAGSSRALPTLSRFVADPSASLRAAAAFALRWVCSPQVEHPTGRKDGVERGPRSEQVEHPTRRKDGVERGPRSEQVDALLIRALETDRDSKVRVEAAAALGFREMTAATLAVEKRLFRTEKAVDVRLAVMSDLWKARQQFPEARRIIAQAAAKDGSPVVRKAAAEIAASDAGGSRIVRRG